MAMSPLGAALISKAADTVTDVEADAFIKDVQAEVKRALASSQKDIEGEKAIIMNDPEIKHLQKATAEGADVRGPLAGQFNRHPDGATPPAYKACKTHSDKQAFRKNWAETQLSNKVRIK